MSTALIYDEQFLDHDTGPGHPERPDRLRAIVTRLHSDGIWERLVHLPFEPANLECIHAVHEPSYVERLRAACRDGLPFIDAPDSTICPESFDIARLAAGGAAAAVDALMAGRVQNAFCALRPPGHHAERDRSMGFCLFNNVAIAAQRLIVRHKIERVGIVDFDVHHGNGTQHTFEDRADVLFISLHEDPSCLYPGTGHASETGRGPGLNTTMNLPMEPGSGDAAYEAAFDEKVLPALRRHQPQVLLVSAGFDAATNDPLAHLTVSSNGFEWMAQQLANTARELCEGRIVCLLEGGYDLESLADGVARGVKGLME